MLPEIASTAELQNDIASKKLLFSNAAGKLGLTPAEYALFALRVQTRRVAYVVIPRHLDGMSWASGGRVSVLHDVIIPANTYGWEVDVVEPGGIAAIYVPARCGNLSLLRKPLPKLARAKRHAPVHVAAATRKVPPAIVPVAKPGVAPVPSPVTAVSVTPPSPTPAPFAAVASSTGPAPHLGWLPFLLIPVVAALFSGHGGQGVPEVPVPITGGGPPPVTVIPMPGPGGFRVTLPTPPPGCASPTPLPH